MNQETEGVSTGPLLGAFLAVVVLCAVFFSLGFFLGYRRAHRVAETGVEPASPASEAPSEVNGPESSQSSVSPEAGSASVPPASGSRMAESAATAASPVAPAPSEQEATLGSEPENDRPLDSGTMARVPPGLLVQVAAVTNRQDAANVVNVLKSKSYPALVLTPAQARAKDNFYRVVAGPYRSRTEAERARKELTAEGFKPFIR